ncbi:MAG: DUF4129 domain-containing protein [Thermoplasmatota archaeon]
MNHRTRATVLAAAASVALLSLVGFLLALESPPTARITTSVTIASPPVGDTPAAHENASTTTPRGPKNATGTPNANTNATATAKNATANATDSTSPSNATSDRAKTADAGASPLPFQIPIPSPGLIAGVLVVGGGFAFLVRVVGWRPRASTDASSAVTFEAPSAALDAVAAVAPARPSDLVIAAYFDACAALEARGCARAPHETAREYCERASDVMALDRDAFGELTSLFELARHGDWRVDAASSERASALARTVRAETLRSVTPPGG